jgi:hypothetical protein
MSAFFIALMFGAGVGGWVYTKLSRRVGLGNQGQAFLGGGIAALGAFIFFFTLLKYVLQIG